MATTTAATAPAPAPTTPAPPPQAGSDLTLQVLHALSQIGADEPLLTVNAFPAVAHADMQAALSRLNSRDMVRFEPIDREEALLEPEGEQIAQSGSHEARVFEALRAAVDGLTIKELEATIGDKTVAKLGQGKAFKEKWISKTQDGRLRAEVASIKDVALEQIRTVKDTRTHPDPKVLADLKKRKLVRMQKLISFRVRRGPKFALELTREETDLTADMVASGAWKSAAFKPYNFRALGADQGAGALHPLNKVRQEIRSIFFEMGFEEMPTSRFVESGFWNFDALFVPQQHPARDLQDTFYISDPPRAGRPGPEGPDDKHSQADYDTYWDNVRQVHQDGKFGSVGYRYPWAEDEALRLVMRTHTTAVSTAMLHRLAALRGPPEPDGVPSTKPPPARYFSIDRVFRNEAVDATHLAEFHQVEGVIADYGLTLGGLMQFMDVFFGKMGISDLRYKPAYNPYTEPSMEIFSYHHGLGKLVEIGNSGMFRPEMLEAMGLPADLRVYGWGLSLERPTMIKYGISNIRELLGNKVDLGFVATNPAVRLDKD